MITHNDFENELKKDTTMLGVEFMRTKCAG